MSETGSLPSADCERTTASSAPRRWYRGVGRYQWLVLVIASVGWIFDAYEGQIFNITRDDMLSDVMRTSYHDANALHSAVLNYGDVFLGPFLAGGALGGIVFGMFADRWGRKPVMVATILFYSVFAALTYFVTELWQVGVLRFFVAIGVGGEWAVAASLVAEVFPQHSRAHASGIFHATSCLGTWLASLVGLAVAAQWRYAYLVSVVPALLVVWVWSSVKEPESWLAARNRATAGKGGKLGSLRELLLDRVWGRRAILGTLLAAVGLGTFWSVTVAGQGIVQAFLQEHGFSHADAASRAKFAYGLVETAGMGLGMLAFGPVCVRLGRRPAFILFQALSLVVVPLTCFGPRSYSELLMLLSLYGFCTLGIHAGFAIYFPELFPNHLRSTGAGFCFNAGRLLAAPVLFFSGGLKAYLGLHLAITLMNLLFVLGIGVVLLLPETKGKPLPE
jgi:MFS family permease